MKNLKNLDFQLQIDSEKSDAELIKYCYGLLLKTKHICNYIERNCLKDLKFKTEGYSGIVITFVYGYPEEKMTDCDEPFITFNKALGINIRFDKRRYDSLKTNNEFREFIRESMKSTFRKIETKYKIPSLEILNSYDKLKEEKFINEWQIKKKTDRTRKLLIELHGSLTINKFILNLKIFQYKKEIYNNIILETVPDEYVYANKFREIVIEEKAVKIFDSANNITFSLSLENILIPEFHK